MKINNLLALTATAVLLAVSSGCVTTNQAALDTHGDQSQLEKRSYQSRYFETGDKEFVMRGLIGTLQDLGFVLDDSNLLLGTVSGTRFFKGSVYKATGSVRPQSDERTLVRLNLQYGVKPIEQPEPYQDIFSSLSKSLFLQENAE